MSNYTDSNLIITTAPNNARAIKIGNKIITGFYDASGGGSSNINFYKCASVDTSNSTWTGYLTSVDPVTGVWSFASIATIGLVYDRLTPQVGKVYNENCTFMVSGYKTGLPEDGLIFYLSFANGMGSTDDTGAYSLDKDKAGSFSFGMRDGILCAEGGGEGDVGVRCATNFLFLPVIPNDSTARYTISAWINVIIDADAGTCFGFTPSISNFRPLAVGTEVHAGNAFLNYNSAQTRIYSMSNMAWAFYHITYDGSKVMFYKNKSLLLDVNASSAFGNVSEVYPVIVQQGNWNSGHLTRGAFAAFRVYNRVLTEEEIDALAAEFTPTL